MSEAGNRPWLTVVTVVKDDEAGLRSTLASLNEQDLAGVEWVVIDSSGDALALAGAMSNDARLPARYQWVAPTGVYPAMNSGLHLATGDYVHFLNAGDTYHDASALSHVREAVQAERPVWLYGQARFVAQDGTSVTPPPFDYLKERASGFSRGRFPPHQATVVSRTALLEVGGFDTSYRIAADYRAMLMLARLAPPIEMPQTLADFSLGGVSTQDWSESVREFHRARREVIRPRGTAALRERFNTARQWGALWAHHALSRGGRP